MKRKELEQRIAELEAEVRVLREEKDGHLRLMRDIVSYPSEAPVMFVDRAQMIIDRWMADKERNRG